jgi:hypothetical protein
LCGGEKKKRKKRKKFACEKWDKKKNKIYRKQQPTVGFGFQVGLKQLLAVRIGVGCPILLQYVFLLPYLKSTRNPVNHEKGKEERRGYCYQSQLFDDGFKMTRTTVRNDYLCNKVCRGESKKKKKKKRASVMRRRWERKKWKGNAAYFVYPEWWR